MNKSDDAVIPRRQRYFKLTVYDTLGQSAVKYFVVVKPQPSAVTISSITPVLNGLEIAWSSNPDAISYVVVCDTENPPVKQYNNIKNTILTILDLNSEVDYYIRVYAMDAFGSGSVGTTHSARPVSLSLKAYALDVPMTKGIVWSTNSRVEWTEGVLTYGSNEYTIVTGNTTDTYIWWDKNTPTTFQHSNDKPTIDTNKWMMAIYDSEKDEVFVAQSGKIIHGGLIQAGTILAEHIGAGEITADRLNIGNWQSAVDSHIRMLLHFDGSLNATSGLGPINDRATLRPDGYFGGGVAVEEATVNLIATQGGAAQDWTAWSHWSTVATSYWASQGTFNDPDYGAVWWGIGTSVDSFLYDYSSYTLLQGKTLTFSIYLKADEEITLPRPRFYTRRADSTFDYVDHDPVSITLTPKWQRFTWTTTVPADAMGIGVHLGFGVLDGKKIYAAYPQLEEKPFATSFVNGSRAAGRLVYPNLYRPRQGTISMRVMFDLDPADWPSFQCLCDWSTSLNDRMLLYTNNQLLKFYVKDATNSIVASIDLGASGQNISAGVWYSVSITWDFNGNACLYFEDVSVTSDISSLSLTAGEINLTVGTDYLFGNFLNGLIDEFRIDDIARTPEEILAWHNSNAPFSDPNAFINKSGTVEITHRGIRVTGSSGVIESGSKSVAFEDIAGWADAADTTLINGGVIKTGTIYLNRIIGSSGTLTISSSGKIIVQSSEGLEVTQGGDISIIGHDTNPGKLNITGTSIKHSMSASATGATLSITSNNPSAILTLGTTTNRYGTIRAYVNNSIDLYALEEAYGARIRVIVNESLALQNIYMRGKIIGDGGGFNGCRIKAGSYTGTGSSKYQQITGIGFLPLAVFVIYATAWSHGAAAYLAAKFSGMGSYAWSVYNVAVHSNTIPEIGSSSNGYFEVSSIYNESDIVYRYIAIG
jgi:hypothetical protein